MRKAVNLAQVPFAPNYFVTDDGRVFRQLSASDDGKGYLRVDLPHDGKAHYSVRLNRLVAGCFLPTPLPHQDLVRHLDGDSKNNTAANLAWGTSAENAEDRGRHGTTAAGERHGCAKLSRETVDQIKVLSSQGWSYRAMAKRFGVDKSTIGRIVRGRAWKGREIDRLQRLPR